MSKAEDLFARTLVKAETAAIKAGGQCQTGGGPFDVKAGIETFVAHRITELRPQPDASKCAAAKLDMTGNFTANLAKVYGKNAKKPDSDKLAADLAKADAALLKSFTKAEALKNGNCLTILDAAANADVASAFIDMFTSLL